MSPRVLALLLVGLGSATAETQADPPLTVKLTHYLHVVPDDPASDLAYTVTMYLGSVEQMEGMVAWHLDKIQITAHDSAGGAPRIWEEVDPETADPSPKWWVNHADINHPLAGEFSELPRISGQAAPADPSYGNLDYEITGTKYVYEDPPFGDSTISLDFSFQPVDEPAIGDEGEEEPADTEPETDPVFP